MKTNKLILLTIVILIITSNLLALGITPARSTFDFLPEEKHLVNLNVINSDSQEMSLIVLVEGELKNSISLSEDEFIFKENDNEKKLSFTLEMPKDLSPGIHTAEIVVKEVPKEVRRGTYIGAIVGVKTQIHVKVPYPGKFAEARLNIMESEDDKIKFIIPINSLGKEDLEKVSAIIDIYSGLNEKIASLNINEISIPSGERKELVVEWDTKNIAPGSYLAVGVINYDGNILSAERRFNVGRRVLNLIGISVSDFKLGDVAKFEMVVESEWSETIKNTYAEMFIYDDDQNEIADLKSATKDIPPQTKTLMEVFWDTAEVEEGLYDTSLLLKHTDKVEQQDFKLDVSDDKIVIIGLGYVISSDTTEIGEGNLVTILIIIISVLALANLSWFLYFRKRLKKKGKKKLKIFSSNPEKNFLVKK